MNGTRDARLVGCVYLSFAFAIVLALALPRVASSNELQPHFAFSTYFGGGLYNNAGTDVTVFNVPMVFEPSWQDIKRLRKVRLRTPVSIGFSNFSLDRIEDTRLNRDTSTLSVAVGLEKDHWDSRRLKFVPFFDLGYAEDFASNTGAFLYALGTSIYRYVDFWDSRQTLYGKIQHAGYAPLRDTRKQDFTSLQIGADIKLSERVNIGPISSFVSVYATSYFYMVGLDFEETDLALLQDEWVHEAGFTWGLNKKIETAVTDIERIGLGYRFSEKGDGLLHISFNFPLD